MPAPVVPPPRRRRALPRAPASRSPACRRAHAPGASCRFVEDVGGLQIDSINVLERAHYLTVWSRFGPYDRAHARPADLSVAACSSSTGRMPPAWSPTAAAAVLAPRDARLPRPPHRLVGLAAAQPEGAGQVRGGDPRQRADGQRRFRGAGPRGRGGWWNWKPAAARAPLPLDDRRPHGPLAPALPEALRSARARDARTCASLEPLSAEAFARWHVERSLLAMGAATENDLRALSHLPALRRRRPPRGARARCSIAGEIAEVAVEGSSGPLARARARPAGARRARGRTDAARARRCSRRSIRCSGIATASTRLFGFDYRIEVYTPGHKRVHGYYTLPILHDGQLIGRVDAKTHRAERRLEVRHVHFEPWFATAEPAPGGRLASIWTRRSPGPRRSARSPRSSASTGSWCDG